MASNVVALIIQARDRASQIVQKTEKGIEKLSGVSSTYHNTLQRLNGTADKFTGIMRNLVAVIGLAGIARSFTEINSSAEKTKLMLAGLLGSTEAAAEAFEWILDVSTELPFSIDAIKDAFIKLQVAGMKPMEGGLRTLTDAIAAFGGSDEDLKLSAIAIQQMAGKGVVSMEELRQQLGERIPTAIKAMAEGMGMSMAQLSKEIEKGNVSATKGINAMMQKLEEWYGGRGMEMMNSWSGLVSNLRVAWEKFAITIGETGVFEKLKGVIDGVLKKINEMKKSGELQEWANRITGMVVRLVEVFTRLAAVFLKVLDALGPFLPALIEMIMDFKTIKFLLGGIIGLPLTLGREIIALSNAAKVLTGGSFIAYLQSLRVALLGAASASTALGIALKATLIGAAFAAGWQIGKWIREWEVFGLTIQSWAEVAWTYLGQFFDNVIISWITVKKYALEAISLGYIDTSAYDRQIKAIEGHKEILKSVRDDILKQRDAQKMAAKAIDETTNKIKKQTDAVEKHQKTYEELIDSIEEGSAQYIAIKDKELKTLKAQIDYEIALEKQKYTKGEISLKEFLQKRQGLLESYIQEVISLKEMELEELKKTPEGNIEKIKAIEEEIKQLKLQSVQEQLKIQQDLTQGLKKEYDDSFNSWKALQELKLETLKNQMELEDAIDEAAAEQGLIRQSDLLERRLQRVREYYSERMRIATEEMRKIAEIEGTESVGYQKLSAERERLQNELQMKIVQSERQITEARMDEEREAQKFMAELTGDRIKLAQIEKEEKIKILKEYYEQGLLTAREYADAIVALEKKITDEFTMELRERSKQLTQWANIITERTRKMWDAVSGFFVQGFEDVRKYFGGVKEALSISTAEVQSQIQAFLNTINHGTAETFWKASLFGRRMTEMVGTSIYEWAGKVTDYIRYVKGLMEDLRETISRYQEDLLRMRGDETALVELWYQRELDRLKGKYAGLEDTAEFQKALALLRELYKEKLKDAEDAMKKEKDMVKDLEGSVSASGEGMAAAMDHVKQAVTGALGSLGATVEGSLGVTQEVNVKKEVRLDSFFKIQTFDPETTQRWLRDTLFPEWEKYMRLKGVEL